MLAPRPIPKLEYHPLSAARDFLFNTFAAIFYIRGRSYIRNLRTSHAMVKGIHLSWVIIFDFFQILYTIIWRFFWSQTPRKSSPTIHPAIYELPCISVVVLMIFTPCGFACQATHLEKYRYFMITSLKFYFVFLITLCPLTQCYLQVLNSNEDIRLVRYGHLSLVNASSQFQAPYCLVLHGFEVRVFTLIWDNTVSTHLYLSFRSLTSVGRFCFLNEDVS